MPEMGLKDKVAIDGGFHGGHDGHHHTEERVRLVVYRGGSLRSSCELRERQTILRGRLAHQYRSDLDANVRYYGSGDRRRMPTTLHSAARASASGHGVRPAGSDTSPQVCG